MDMLTDGSPYVPQVPSYLKTRMIKMLETNIYIYIYIYKI